MCIIKFYKIIFKSGFFQTLKCHTSCIDTKCRCTGMRRNTFCINFNLTILFRYLILLKLCISKCCFQFFFQTDVCRDHGCTTIAHRIGYKATIHRNNFGMFGICHHGHMALFTMDTWEIRIRCKTAG